MRTDDTHRASFDEQAALKELERLQRAIEESRQRRKQVVAAFDDFVRSFGRRPGPAVGPATAPSASDGLTPPGASAASPPSPSVTVPSPQPPPVPVVAQPPPSTSSAQPPPVAPAAQSPPFVVEATSSVASSVASGVMEAPHVEAPVVPRSFDLPAAPAAWAPRRRQLRMGPAWVFAAALLVIVAGVVMIRSWRSRALAPGSEAQTTATPAAAVTPPNAETPAPAADPDVPPTFAPIGNGAVPGEIIALRRVWVRVFVDGQRELERELPAGATVPLRADRTIVIRTGDAGAVRLVIDGQDRGVLGRNGEVVTQLFTARRLPER
jgi:uncharacterized protein DUF4115